MSDLRTRLENTLDQYRIDGQVGQGGMAVVFQAHDLKHNRRVALKVMKPEIGSSFGSERFRREIDIAAKLAHPHILPLYDSGAVQDLHYLVMPFVDGDSLRDRLNREGALALEEAVRITREVAGALEHAHASGLIHRDVKPENILFQAGHAAVTDFGIARAITTEDGETQLTGTGMAVGTVTYMSPEQAAGNSELDQRTDVYSLGCVLYEMLEGSPPFEGNTPQAVLANKVTAQIPEFSDESMVPTTVADVTRKALAAEPQHRYPTAADFARALETAITTEAIEAAATRRRRTRVFRVLGAAVAIIAIALGIWWGTNLVAGPGISRVALLPLENETADATQDFYIDGMHDALITEFGQAGIEVIGRRSVMRYGGGDDTPVREIARELNVDAVIEGFAFRDGDSVGMRIRLVDGVTEAGLWTESFDAVARDVIGLYRRVTAALARELNVTLSAEAAARLASAAPVDPAAYEAYLNGMYHWYRLTPQDLELAERYFARALEIDPDYALAHRGVAALWAARQQFGFASPSEAGPRIRSATQRALESDSTLAEAHFGLATLRTWTDWDWVGAEQAFQRALAQNPGYAEARAYYAHLLVYLGRPEEAIAQAAQAVEIDPLNTLISALGCVTLALVGRYDEAIAQCNEVLRLDPTQPVARDGLGAALHGSGRLDEYLAHQIRFFRAMGDEELAQALEHAHREAGYEQAMRVGAEMMVARSEVGFVPPSAIALMFDDAGDLEQTLDWLERAERVRDPALPYLMVSPWRSGVQNSPRFLALAQRIGIRQPN